jgi:hypothetical protein
MPGALERLIGQRDNAFEHVLGLVGAQAIDKPGVPPATYARTGRETHR